MVHFPQFDLARYICSNHVTKPQVLSHHLSALFSSVLVSFRSSSSRWWHRWSLAASRLYPTSLATPAEKSTSLSQ